MRDANRCRALAAAAVMMLWASPACADGGPNGPDWAFGVQGGEALLAGVCVFSLGSYFVPQHVTSWGAARTWDNNDAAGMVSNFTGSIMGSMFQIAVGYGFEAAYYGDHGAAFPLSRSFRTSLMDLEAMTLSAGITVGIKRVAGRCRPRAWKMGVCGPKDAENDAFPSGHVSPVAAIAGSHLVLALRSDGASVPRYTAFAVSETATVVTAVLRVLAGAHSWDDVVGGWMVGHVSGGLVALAHPMTVVQTGPRVPMSPGMAGSPQATERGTRAQVFAFSGAF